jgi:hypothetical protein
MKNWHEHLALKDEVKDLYTYKCPINPLSFYSIHSHQRTDLPFKVRHIPFNICFKPQDHKQRRKKQAQATQ